MFRKLSFDPLPDEDCHCILRQNLVHKLKTQGYEQPPICVSIAYDW